MADWVISVSQLNEYVRKKLAGDLLLQAVSVKGEISDLKSHYASGHLYFTLKDDKARIACIMYNTNAAKVGLNLKNGLKIIASGRAGIYPANGQYQLYIETVKLEGLGSIYERFEALKAKLREEGLFDEKYKKPIPQTVHSIGVATSESGAALRDIIRVARNRNPKVSILVAPCQVQGLGAENEIAEAVKRLDKSGKCDVILVGRGGGSIEDLWCFNEEIVARAIFACKTPVVSCVGHETDFTIADFVSDVRAATPSNAAEIAVNDVKYQKKRLLQLVSHLDFSIKNAQIQRHMKLEMLYASACFKNPAEFMLEKPRTKLEALFGQMKIAESQRIGELKNRIDNDFRMLETLNPDNVKKRGYACVRKNGVLVTDINGIKPGDGLEIEFKSGTADVAVTGTTSKD